MNVVAIPKFWLVLQQILFVVNFHRDVFCEPISICLVWTKSPFSKAERTQHDLWYFRNQTLSEEITELNCWSHTALTFVVPQRHSSFDTTVSQHWPLCAECRYNLHKPEDNIHDQTRMIYFIGASFEKWMLRSRKSHLREAPAHCSQQDSLVPMIAMTRCTTR